jgi:hypothetical protein
VPPVRVFTDAAWAQYEDNEPVGAVLARSTILRSPTKATFDVELPGATVCFATRSSLRLLLVHEFAHALFALGSALLGRTVVPGDVADSEYDAATLVNPAEWFGREDAEQFALHNDPRNDYLSEAIGIEWIAAGLPATNGVVSYSFEGEISFPKAVADRVRASGCRSLAQVQVTKANVQER